MRRVSVIGCCGAGKSTFARELHRITGLPLIHLDKEFWRAGWKESDKDEFGARVRDACSRETWIIDGHYFSTLAERLARADTLFHLDYPTRICLRRTLGRTMSNLGRDREDCAEGCPERFELEFFRYVAGFRREFRERTLKLIREYPHLTVYSFRHPREATAYLCNRPDSVVTRSPLR